MTLTINTNISSIIAQRNLNNATNSLNKSIEKMSTGFKINHAGDNAAGYSIANNWKTQIGSLDVAADNAATGADLLTTAEDTYSLLTSHLQRVRDLTEQAANGTYGSQSLKAIQSEIYARFQEISRISANSEFNGIKLMSYVLDADDPSVNKDTGLTENGINLQVGLYANQDGRINLSIDLFSDASASGLFSGLLDKKLEDSATLTLAHALGAATFGNEVDPDSGDVTKFSGEINEEAGLKTLAAACSGLVYKKAAGDDPEAYYLQTSKFYGAREMLGFVDKAIADISNRVTAIGAAQNRVDSALSAIDVQSQNITSSLSTLRDTDVAEESSNYIQAQILQQASATLLSTANQLPSIALNLI